MQHYSLYIFDADGTLRQAKSNACGAPSDPNDWELLPSVASWFRRNPNIRWGIASNQGGVQLGYVSEQDASEALRLTAEALGGVPAEAVLMETSFDKDHPRRKPNPGMLRELMDYYGVRPDETIMIGDMESDALAANAAGCDYAHPKEIFGWE